MSARLVKICNEEEDSNTKGNIRCAYVSEEESGRILQKSLNKPKTITQISRLETSHLQWVDEHLRGVNKGGMQMDIVYVPF